MRGAGFVSLVTLIYPIAWGCSEGGNVISVNGEMVWYGILDLLLGPLFLFYFVWGLRNVDYGAFGFHSGKHADGQYGTGGVGRHGHGTVGTTAGTTPPMAGANRV